MMITNKSTAVRLGRTKRWSLQSSSNDLAYYQFSNKFQQLVDTFFSDSQFRDRGIAYSHSTINFGLRSVQIQSFLQDAKISDFIGTFSRRSLFAYHRKFKSQRYGAHLSRGLRRVIFREPSQFTFRKRFLFFKSSRSSAFLPLTVFNRVFHSVYSMRASRMRRFRRYLRYKRSCFISFYNYFYSQHNFRLRYYTFVSRMFSNFFYNTCHSPVLFSFNHIVPRHSTANLYLNYICAKLYYRYILSDVVNPIVRLSLRQYRGFSITCKGRFTRAQIATQKGYRKGALSFSYMKNHLDYAQRAVTLKYGTCNLKLWIRRLRCSKWLAITISTIVNARQFFVFGQRDLSKTSFLRTTFLWLLMRCLHFQITLVI